MPNAVSTRLQVAISGTGVGVAEKRLGCSLLVGGAEKNSRYVGGCRKSAKKGLENVPPAMAYPNPCTVSCGDSILTRLSTANGSFPGMGVPVGCKLRIAEPFRAPAMAVMRKKPDASGLSTVVKVPPAVMPAPEYVQFQLRAVAGVAAAARAATVMRASHIKVRFLKA